MAVLGSTMWSKNAQFPSRHSRIPYTRTGKLIPQQLCEGCRVSYPRFLLCFVQYGIFLVL